MMATNIFIHPSRIIHSLLYKLCTIFVKFLFRVLTTPPSFKQLWVSIFANSTTLEKTSWTFKAAKFQLVTIPSSISCAYIYLYILSKKTVLIKATFWYLKVFKILFSLHSSTYLLNTSFEMGVRLCCNRDA